MAFPGYGRAAIDPRCKQPRSASRSKRPSSAERRSGGEVNDLESSAPRSASVNGRMADESAGRSIRSVELRSRPRGLSRRVRSAPLGAHDTPNLATCAASCDTRNRVRSATYRGGPRRFVASHSPFPGMRPRPYSGLTSPPATQGPSEPQAFRRSEAALSRRQQHTDAQHPKALTWSGRKRPRRARAHQGPTKVGRSYGS